MTLIECHALSRRFGAVRALDALNLVIAAGPPVALVGPNGAGKSTLINLLCGYLLPSAGTLRVLGVRPGSRSLQGRLAALPQAAHFDPAIGVGRQLRFQAELLGMSRRQARLDSERVMLAVGLGDALLAKPRALSHGMLKRVAVAQSLLGRPTLVLLDEPTAGVDPPTVSRLREVIREHAADITFLVSSHNLDELERLCTSVVFLDKGTLREQGTIQAPSADGWLTVKLLSAAGAGFADACRALPGVREVSPTTGNAWLIRHDGRAGVDRALLGLLADERLEYRYLMNGRSLEQRFYTRTSATEDP